MSAPALGEHYRFSVSELLDRLFYDHHRIRAVARAKERIVISFIYRLFLPLKMSDEIGGDPHPVHIFVARIIVLHIDIPARSVRHRPHDGDMLSIRFNIA